MTWININYVKSHLYLFHFKKQENFADIYEIKKCKPVPIYSSEKYHEMYKYIICRNNSINKLTIMLDAIPKLYSMRNYNYKLKREIVIYYHDTKQKVTDPC